MQAPIEKMSLTPYPLFIVPEEFPAVPHRELPRPIARKYFEWFTGIYTERIPVLLDYFNEHLTGSCSDDLRRLGMKIAELVLLAQFSYMPEDPVMIEPRPGYRLQVPPEPKLTGEGISMAVDMGCLLASCILHLDERITWHFVTRPKKLLEYQQPTLIEPWIGIPFDPVDLSIGYCTGIYKKIRLSDIWAICYEHIKARVPPRDA